MDKTPLIPCDSVAMTLPPLAIPLPRLCGYSTLTRDKEENAM